MKRLLAILSIVFLLPAAALAQFTDDGSGHWGQTKVNNLVSFLNFNDAQLKVLLARCTFEDDSTPIPLTCINAGFLPLAGGTMTGDLVLSADTNEGLSGGGLTDCSNSTTSKVLYNGTTHKFSCGTDQTGGAGGVGALTGDSGGNTTGSTISILGGTNGIDTIRSGDTITINFDSSEVGADAFSDSQVSDTLTSSKFHGSGSSTDAVDLGTAEVAGTLGAGNGGTGVNALGANVQTALGQDINSANGLVTRANLTAPTPFCTTLTDADGSISSGFAPMVWWPDQAIHITKVRCASDGGGVTAFNVKREDGAPVEMLTSDISCPATWTTTPPTTFVATENAIAATDAVSVSIDASGGDTWVAICFDYTVDP